MIDYTARIWKDVAEFEKILALPERFYYSLLQEDDWSFVIKLHALIEAAATQAICTAINCPELIDNIATLDIGNAQHGKIKLMTTLKVITAEQAGVLRQLTELRNHLVHRIQNVGFSFGTYLTELSDEKRKATVKKFGFGIKDSVSHDGKQLSRYEFVLREPVLSLWLTMAEVIACMYLEFERNKPVKSSGQSQPSTTFNLLEWIALHGITGARDEDGTRANPE